MVFAYVASRHAWHARTRPDRLSRRFRLGAFVSWNIGAIPADGGRRSQPHWANASGAAAITGTQTYTINANGSGTFANLQTAFDYFSENLIGTGSTDFFTVNLNAATHSYSSSVTIQSPFTKVVNFVGATPITTTMSGVQSSSGSAGARSITVNLASTAGMAVGQVAVFSGCSGGTNPFYMEGAWMITSVDSINNRITITSTSRSSNVPSGTVTSNVTVLTTVIKFTGCYGINIYSGGTALNLQNIAIVGDGSSGNIGLNLQDVGRCFIAGTVAVLNFGGANIYGNYNSELNGSGALYSSGSQSHGFYFNTGAVSEVYPIVSSGNGSMGFYVSYAMASAGSRMIACGNGSHGVGLYSGGCMTVTAGGTIVAQGNGGWGLYAQDGGLFDYAGAGSATFGGNTSGDVSLLMNTINGNYGGGFDTGWGGRLQGFSDGGLVQSNQYRTGLYLNGNMTSVGANNGSSVTTHASFSRYSSGCDSISLQVRGPYNSGLYFFPYSGSSPFTDDLWQSILYVNSYSNYMTFGINGTSFSNVSYNALNFLAPIQSGNASARIFSRWFETYSAGGSYRSLFFGSEVTCWSCNRFQFWSTEYGSRLCVRRANRRRRHFLYNIAYCE